MLFAIVSFLAHPIDFTRSWQRARRDFDAEGRYVGPLPGWQDGLNEDGTRKDGKPAGYKQPLWRSS
jgi:hypothetical protein